MDSSDLAQVVAIVAEGIDRGAVHVDGPVLTHDEVQECRWLGKL